MAYTFSLTLADSVPSASREELLVTLRTTADDVQVTSDKGFDWNSIIVILHESGKIAGEISAIVLLAKQLNDWRKRTRAAGTLHRPGVAPLNLATATDEELLAWLLATKPAA